MAPTTLFTVQKILPGQSRAEAHCVSLETSSPATAAEIVLGRHLVSSGKPAKLRALVWHMQPDFTPVCTQFYEPVRARVAEKPLKRLFKRVTAGATSRIPILQMILICVGTCVLNAALVTLFR